MWEEILLLQTAKLNQYSFTHGRIQKIRHRYPG
jgi:hypothetical protein